MSKKTGSYYFIPFLAVFCLIVLAVSGCSTEGEGGPFWPDVSPTPTHTVSPTPTPTPTPPVVSSVTPASAVGGTTVTIKGSHFGDTQTRATSTVLFNGVEPTEYVSWGDTEIQCKVPAMCNTGGVVVQVDGLNSNSDVIFTRERTWRGAAAINGDPIYDGGGIQMAMDPQGNAVAGFYIYDGNQQLFAMVYNAATGVWSTPVRIDNGQAQGVDKLKLAMDADGNAFAIFVQYDTDLAYRLVYVNRYDAVTGQWQTVPQVVNDGQGYWPDRPQVATDALGNAICIFQNYNGTTDRIYYNRYNATTGQWMAEAGLVDLNAGTSANRPELAVDASGNAICVFEKHDGTNTRIFSNYYNATAGTWGSTLPMADNGPGTLADFKSRVGFDSTGKCILVFKQHDGTVYNIYANKYTPGTNSWAGATILSDATYNADKPQLDVSPSGNAVCVYKQPDGALNRVYAVYYNGTTGQWATADREIVDASTGYHAEVGPVKMDLFDNAITVFNQYFGGASNNRIFGNFFNWADKVWEGATQLDTDVDNATSPQLNLDSAGNGMLIYKLNNGTNTRIFANKYW